MMRTYTLVPFVTMLFTHLTATHVQAQTNETFVSLGNVTFGGTGCSSNLQPVYSPDRTALSVLFETFEVSADSASPLSRKNCDLSIPVHVPPGLRVTLIGADLRGFNDLPQGASSTLAVEYFLSGAATNLVNTSFFGPLTNNYILQHNVEPTNQPNAACGGSSILRIATSLRVSTNEAGQRALSTVDSTDLVMNDAGRDNAVVIHLTYQTCTPNLASAFALSGALLFLTTSLALLL